MTKLQQMMRLLALVAVVSLSFAGGSFSHAAESHEHGFGITSTSDAHSHINSDGDLVEPNDALHCGSNILSLSETNTIGFADKGRLAPLGNLNVSIAAFLEHELPPPRPIS